VQHMRSKSHEFDVLGRAVFTLAVHDRSLKHVTELCPSAEVVGPHKVHHTPVLQQVVLQWIASQHHPTSAIQTILKSQVITAGMLLTQPVAGTDC